MDAVFPVLSCGPEALWVSANAKWATWNTFRYVLKQKCCKHHLWAKLALPCRPVNKYIAAIKNKRSTVPVFTYFSTIGESCIHRGTDYGHLCIIIYSKNINFCYKQSMPHTCNVQMRYTVTESICRIQEGCLIFPISTIFDISEPKQGRQIFGP